jgi:hypothetical protein
VCTQHRLSWCWTTAPRIYPSRDPEGNGPGARFGIDAQGAGFMLG